MNQRHNPSRWMFVLVLLLAAAPAAGQVVRCRDAPAWIAGIPQTTVCGCTRPEAESLARTAARNLCAGALGATNCAPLTCDPDSHTACETVVTRAPVDAACGPAPAGAICPPNCPEPPVQCVIPAQRLQCDCKCNPNRCNEAHWTVSRDVSLGCVNNTEEAKRSAARAAFLGECDGARDKVACPDRECSDDLECVPVIHGNIPKPSCNADPTCLRGQVRCTAKGTVRCTCACEPGT